MKKQPSAATRTFYPSALGIHTQGKPSKYSTTDSGIDVLLE